MMIPHGPDKKCFDGASKADLKPVKLQDGVVRPHEKGICYDIRFLWHYVVLLLLC